VSWVLARVASVNVGRAGLQAGRGRPYPTAIAKHPCAGPVAIGPLGLAGDEQADLAHHGGPDQALHAHFARHLATWGALRGRPLLPGDIGENLTLTGDPEPDEGRFCIGDIIAAGTARLQVSQPRVPCYKQADRLGIADALALAKAAGRTGFYLRVLQPGQVAAGDALVLVDRPHPDVTVALVNRVLHLDRADAAGRARVAACPELGARLRAAVAQ
jgi:MOSC domain-containing protein YiiM